MECAFAKLKALLTSAVERTIDGLWHRVNNLLDRLNPQECANDRAAVGCDAI
jgi:hypothetical protein